METHLALVPTGFGDSAGNGRYGAVMPERFLSALGAADILGISRKGRGIDE
jgi:hypothetical protein